jgi:magnesium transporter
MVVEELEKLLEEKKYIEFRRKIQDMPPQDIAELLEELESTQAIIAFRLLPKEKAADVFSYLSSELQAEISLAIDDKKLMEIIDDLFFDDKIDFLEEMPANVVSRILKNSTEAERKLINQFLKYPPNSAGSLMTIEFIDLKKERTVQEALDKIRIEGQDVEMVYNCYVTDSKRKLEGIVSLKELVLAPPNAKVEDIMRKDVIYVNTHDDQETVAQIFRKYDLIAVPVVDSEKRLVGIITVDDILDAIEEETTEDIHHIGGMSPSDKPYLSSSPFTLARKRFWWLLILMISGTISASIISKYEATLQQVVGLIAFIPILMDTAGNAGSQSSTMIIRSLTLGEVKLKDIFKVIWKELQISIIIVIGLATINFLKIHFLESYPVEIAFTVSIALMSAVCVANVIGGALPIIAQLFHIDPTVMAGPIITTIADAASLTIYFALATHLLNISA